MTHRIRLTAAGAVVGTLALLVSMITPANAALLDVSFVITGGSITINGQDFPIPSGGTSGITGQWDDTTGAFTDEFTIPNQSFDQHVDNPLAGTIHGSIAMTSSPVSGNIDPATGAVALTASLTVALTLNTFDLDAGGSIDLMGVVCTITPVNLNLASSGPGGANYAPVPVMPTTEDGTFAVGDSGFNVPQASCTDAAFDSQINDTLGLATTNTSATIAFQTGQIQQVTTTTAAPTTTTTAPATTTARAATTTPAFTG